jgi:PPM family protein phosphatase
LTISSKLAEVEFAGLTETGNIRDDNQDAILVPETTLPGMFAFLTGLADGMGGYASGDIASKLALSIFHQVVLDARGASIEKTLRRGVEVANLEIYKTARELNNGRMGSTLTIAYIAGDQLFLAHVGDSRAYLVRNGNITSLTSDHTVVGDLVRSHLIQPESVRTHSQRSILTRAVGLDLFVTPDITSHKLYVGDRLILCSDGVWSVLEDQQIATLAVDIKTPKTFVYELIQKALSNNSDDNCSAVVADIQVFRPLATPVVEPVRRKWFGVFESK